MDIAVTRLYRNRAFYSGNSTVYYPYASSGTSTPLYTVFPHNTGLTSMQGGNTTERYHLLFSEYSKVVNIDTLYAAIGGSSSQDFAVKDLTVSNGATITNDFTVQGITLRDSTDRSGLLEINRKGTTTYSGIQIKFSTTALWSVFGNETTFGIYDDYNSKWSILATKTGSVGLYFNGVVKLETSSTGITVSGNINATGTGTNLFSGVTSITPTTNSAWAATITNNGTTDAHGLSVSIGASSTGIPFRVLKDTNNLLHVANNGDVGIGAVAGGYKLDVNGTVRIQSTLYTDTINQATTAGVTLFATNGLYVQNSSGVNSLSITGNAVISHTGVRSNNFISGWAGGTGWNIDYSTASLEISNLTVRGTLSIYELLMQQVRATNGNIMISASAKIESITSGTAYAEVVVFEDPSGHGVCPFAAGDLVLCQRANPNSSTIVKQIVRYVLSVSGTTVTFEEETVGPPDTGTLSIGDDFVRIGNQNSDSRAGSIYLSSDDTYAPYIDILSGVYSWDEWYWGQSSTVKVRLGKLDGITDTEAGLPGGGGTTSSGAPQVNYYGLYSNNVHLKGHIYAQSGNIGGWSITSTQLTKGTIILDASATPYIAIGATSYTTGNGVWLSTASTTKFRVGNAGASRMLWNDTDFQIYNSANTLVASFGGTNSIAGWSITSTQLSKSSIVLDASATPYIALGATSYTAGDGIWLSTTSTTKFRVGNSTTHTTNKSRLQWTDTNLEFYDYTGTMVVTIGQTTTIGGYTIDSDSLYNSTVTLGTYGVYVRNNGYNNGAIFFVNEINVPSTVGDLGFWYNGGAGSLRLRTVSTSDFQKIEILSADDITLTATTTISLTATSGITMASATTFSSTITGSDLTASTMLGTNASKQLVSLATASYPTLTELGLMKPQSTSVANPAPPAPVGSKYYNEYYITALAAGVTFSAPSGTPANGNILWIRIKDNGTARALAFNAIYVGRYVALPTTTVVNRQLALLFHYNSTTAVWELVEKYAAIV